MLNMKLTYLTLTKSCMEKHKMLNMGVKSMQGKIEKIENGLHMLQLDKACKETKRRW